MGKRKVYCKLNFGIYHLKNLVDYYRRDKYKLALRLISTCQEF